jgi:HlyD family secretion protein
VQNVFTYTTVMRTDNPDLRLRPGMTANVTVHVARRDEALRVPAAALRFRPPMPQGKGGRGARGEMAGGGGGRGGAGGGGVERGGVARADVAPGQSGGQGAGRGGRWRGANGAGGDSSHAGGWRGRGGAGAMAVGGAPGMAAAPGGRGIASQPGRAARGVQQSGGEVVPASIDEADESKPGNVYVLRNGKPEKVSVVTGLTDGSFVEIRGGELKEGDPVVLGLDQSANRNGNQLAPPPGLGGPGFGGRGGGGRR